MRDCIVNGRAWSEAVAELKAATPKKDKKMKFEFIPIEEYMKLLDKAVGVSNYTVEYSMPQYNRIASGQDFLSVKCRITILDDEGNMVIFKEGLGASEFAYSQDNGGRDVNLKNSPVYAQQSAFKTAAKDLGCFDFYGTDEVSDTKSTATGTKAKGSSRAATSSAKKKPLSVSGHSDGAYFSISENVNGEKTYKLPVIIDGIEGKSEIIFYPNNCRDESVKGSLNRLFVDSKKGSAVFKASVRPCDDRDGMKQFVFLSFAN